MALCPPLRLYVHLIIKFIRFNVNMKVMQAGKHRPLKCLFFNSWTIYERFAKRMYKSQRPKQSFLSKEKLPANTFHGNPLPRLQVGFLRKCSFRSFANSFCGHLFLVFSQNLPAKFFTFLVIYANLRNFPENKTNCKKKNLPRFCENLPVFFEFSPISKTV